MQKNKPPFITDCTDVKGKRVIVRSSLNVPYQDGVVCNYFRIMRALPTLLHLTHAGAKVILIGHIGREKNETLRPVCDVLGQHLRVTWSDKIIGPDVEKKIEALDEGHVLFLENLRSNDGETKNDEKFAKTLASYGDIYVNDAFAASHRVHASIVGIPKYLESYFGLTFREEYMQLIKVMDPVAPSIFVLGGAKFATKEPLVEKYVNKYDRVFVGGALANDFFRAKGYEIGDSLVSDSDPKKAGFLDHEKIITPIDVTVQSKHSIRVTTPDAVEKGERILDAGPATIASLEDFIQDASMVLWNGPLGNYEHGFVEQTRALAKVVAKSKAHSVIGGGDTIAAIEPLAINDQFNFISTAGGAMLTFLETSTLPAIDAVMNR